MAVVECRGIWLGKGNEPDGRLTVRHQQSFLPFLHRRYTRRGALGGPPGSWQLTRANRPCTYAVRGAQATPVAGVSVCLTLVSIMLEAVGHFPCCYGAVRNPSIWRARGNCDGCEFGECGGCHSFHCPTLRRSAAQPPGNQAAPTTGVHDLHGPLV